MLAIRFHETGGPETLLADEVERPQPGPGQARVRLAYAGVNFIDSYLRSGRYDPGRLPAIAGKEGAGVVDAVGPGAEPVAVGDRVSFFGAEGAYAEWVTLPADRLLPLPPEVGLRDAAALTLQGLTAHYLLRTIHPLEPGERVLVHAAAGGVGLLAVQLARAAGAEIFGTCSTEEKAAAARDAGADHLIRYTERDFVEAVLDGTGGEGVDLALDGVGRSTFRGSVRATRIRGEIVLFGQASGEPDPIRPRRLLGSRTLTTASLFDYTRTREELESRGGALFALVGEGTLVPRIDRVLPLREAPAAHRALEGRETIGKVLLEVDRELET